MSGDASLIEQPFKRLFNQLNDPVVEFELDDGEPIIVETNEAFADTFAPETDSLVDEPLNDLIVPADRYREAETFDRRTESGESNAAVVERVTVDGPRQFVYRGVPCGDDYGFAIYTDVTQKLRRERHLDVLQRVLRHNLRNDLNIVLGLADEIATDADSERIAAAATSIKETAEGLTRLSEEAKVVQQVLGETTALKPIPVAAPVADAVADCRQRFPEATITADTPSDLCVRADSNLGLVVETLLDNAIRHNTTADSEATVSVTTTEAGGVELTVADNGPGIPPTEREVVTGDADITPLTHGSGLGLWLVRWITDGYGGDLAIETPPSGGTVVRIFLDAAADADSDVAAAANDTAADAEN